MKKIPLIVGLVVMSCCISCTKKTSVAQQTEISAMDSTEAQPEVTSGIFLALGDSYTIGQSVDSAGRFPAQTAALLQSDSVVFAGIEYIAATGWTTTDLLTAINNRKSQRLYKAVTLLIGVNDQYRYHTTEGYKEVFTEALQKAIVFAGEKSHVFVLSIPDYGVTPFGAHTSGTGEQIDAFNAINKEVATQFGVHYVDVTSISRADKEDETMIAEDGLHPSAKQYAQWAQALAPVMKQALR